MLSELLIRPIHESGLTYKEEEVNQKNTWVLVGMALQAVVAGSLATVGVISLNASQQVTAAAFFVVVIVIWMVITKEQNKILLGMCIQAVTASILAVTGLIDLNPIQQFIAAGLYGFVILVHTLLSQNKKIA